MELKRTIIQIVPRRAREPDGIGDYGTLLARALLERAGIESVFLSGTPVRTELPRADDWHTVPVRERTASDLVAQLSELCRTAAPLAVVIHVSGYGYEKRGVPYWLLQGLRAWRRTHANCSLLGVFHELFATGRIWNSSFWLSQPQRRITQGIWDLCDGALTTTAPFFEQLVAWRPNMAQHAPHDARAFECRRTKSSAARSRQSVAAEHGNLRPAGNPEDESSIASLGVHCRHQLSRRSVSRKSSTLGRERRLRLRLRRASTGHDHGPIGSGARQQGTFVFLLVWVAELRYCAPAKIRRVCGICCAWRDTNLHRISGEAAARVSSRRAAAFLALATERNAGPWDDAKQACPVVW